jgi:hypothetical protein
VFEVKQWLLQVKKMLIKRKHPILINGARRKQARRLAQTRLLFLDVDGVLNDGKTIQMYGMFSMCTVFVKRLADIIKETECKIVISSTWRKKGIGKDSEFQKALWEACIDKDDFFTVVNAIVGATPEKFSHQIRGMEIEDWFINVFKSNKIEHQANWVIVDDDSDMGKHLHRLVKTKFHGNPIGTENGSGLTKEATDFIIKKLTC